MRLKIVMLGSGNVACHLSRVFNSKGHLIIQVYSRNIEHAKDLSQQFNTEAIDDLNLINPSADLYIIAVSDAAIGHIIENIDLSEKKVVHTAGSIPISVFNDQTKDCGVFYPFQTFSKNRIIDFNRIPICIEANNSSFKTFLTELANQISHNIWQIDSETRKILHLSGIYANNFVNHLYAISETILKQKEIPFEILNELIRETASKAIEIGPEDAQTGPAKRNDKEILKKHLDLLSSTPDLYQIYDLLSKSIGLKYNQL